MTPNTAQPSQQQPDDITPPRPERTSSRDLLSMVMDATDASQGFRAQIIETAISRDVFDNDWRLAKVFALSGEFDGIKNKTPDQGIAAAMARIQIGRSWGMTPGDSMQHIRFESGKPQISNEYLAARMRQAGYAWDIDWEKDASGWVTRCTLWVKKWNAEEKKYLPLLDHKAQPVSVSFGKIEADRIKIWEGQGDAKKQISLSQKWNYVSWAPDMYYWRNIARIKRWFATDVLAGARLPVEEGETSDGGSDNGPLSVQSEARQDTPEMSSNAGAAKVATENKAAALQEKLKAAKSASVPVPPSVPQPEVKKLEPVTSGTVPSGTKELF